MSTRERVIKLVSEVLETPEAEVRLDADFATDLGMTSLDLVNLVWRVEQTFSLGEIPESVLESLRTVTDLIHYVEVARDDESEVFETHDAIGIASDHAGIELKKHLCQWLSKNGRQVVDLGPSDSNAVDYPNFAQNLARRVARGELASGILICGSGIGMSIAANKVDGIRAALVSEPVSASLSRQHNNANVLCLGARTIGPDMASACVKSFLETSFQPGDDGRHQRRIQMISDLEKG